ncbi:MAG: bile acid:sodium symporter [Verrucomicrobia bacterium]|nr:bile acid:sodium symporter [Verrucomicrobiota bacterium]
MKRRPDGFLLSMLVVLALAWLFPEPGARGGWLRPEILTKVGVALIFFLHGAALPLAALKAGTLRWPLHVVVQLTTFLVFPLLGLLIVALAGPVLGPDLRLGVFYLCALPSTVSSSIAFTAAARGNVPAAVFNATLSGLLGVFLTPLWIGVLLTTAGQALPLGRVIGDLALWLLLPLALGQASRPLIGAFVTAHRRRIGLVDRATILLLVYTSFADSFQQGVWSGRGLGLLLALSAGAVALFAVVAALVGRVCDALGFSAEDRIAAILCGSKKTLASGVPMASLIFGAHPALGVILLPIMLYHQLQLLICAWLVERWSRRPL